jgi:hypothetical protein
MGDNQGSFLPQVGKKKPLTPTPPATPPPQREGGEGPLLPSIRRGPGQGARKIKPAAPGWGKLGQETDDVCYYCKKPGHWKVDCPKLKEDEFRKSIMGSPREKKDSTPRVEEAASPSTSSLDRTLSAAQSMRTAHLDKAKQRAEQQKKLDISIFRKAFKALDTDGSGAVEASEVYDTLAVFGKYVDKKNFWGAFSKADLNHDQVIDEEEFVLVMLALTEGSRRKNAKRFQFMQNRLKLGARRAGKAAIAAKQKKQKKTILQEKIHQRPPQMHQRVLPEGSTWMSEMMQQQRALADLYKARQRFQGKAMAAKLLKPPEDPRMRTMLGRRLVEAEHRAHERASKQAEEQAAQKEMAALDTFTNMFGKGS